jgi:hypothetical protein
LGRYSPFAFRQKAVSYQLSAVSEGQQLDYRGGAVIRTGRSDLTSAISFFFNGQNEGAIR